MNSRKYKPKKRPPSTKHRWDAYGTTNLDVCRRCGVVRKRTAHRKNNGKTSAVLLYGKVKAPVFHDDWQREYIRCKAAAA